jgi:hypothetical protein
MNADLWCQYRIVRSAVKEEDATRQATRFGVRARARGETQRLRPSTGASDLCAMSSIL